MTPARRPPQATAQLGDVFAAAVRPHLDRLRRLVARQVPPALVDDVMQDALLRAFRSWHRFDPTQPVWPWLARIARRACATAWRADFRWKCSPGAAPVAAGADAPGSDRHVAALHARAVVAATLAELAPRDRVLLYRGDAEEAPRQVLADTVTLAPGAVRVALHRARQRFRAFARGRWDDAGFAVGVATTRLRLRARQSQAQAWAVPASVLVTVVVAVSSSPITGPEPARAAPAAQPRHPPADATRAMPQAVPARQAAEPDAAEVATSVVRQAASRAHRPPQPAPSSPSPGAPLVPAAQVDLGPDGLYGGVRVDYTLPTNGQFTADPSVRCRHSLATHAVCTATGAAPSAGPVEFYGSGNGNP